MKYLYVLILMLSPLFSFCQTGSEIYLFDIHWKNGQPILSNPVNITNHKGYDNQPFFHPSKKIIYYSSFNDSGRSDIKSYNYKSNQTNNITRTPEREYSPTITPDKKFISCIIQRDNNAQDLGKYPIAGGKPTVLIPTLKIGYHVWIDSYRLLLFVLGDSGHNTLHYYNLITKEDAVLPANPGRSLHKIPGLSNCSFIHKISKEEWVVKQFNPATKDISVICPALPGREDICWLKKDFLFSSDGTRFFYNDISTINGWQTISVENNNNSTLKGISRLTVNSNNTKLAVVLSE